LLKLSGELLGGARGVGLDPDGLDLIASQIADAHGAGAQVAVVLGGGNLLRGAAARRAGWARTDADAIGMLGTLINALAIAHTLGARGIPARVLSAFEVARLADLYRADRGRASLDAGEVLLCAGGTGNPYFSTDTAAALRALELGCTLLIKGTKVDGVYAADPRDDADCERFEKISYRKVIERRLGVIDLTAVTLCLENALPIVVLNATERGSIGRLLAGEAIGTRIDDHESTARDERAADAGRGGSRG
jgi:uridylate kinase